MIRLLLLSVLFACTASASVTIVSEGQARALIVIADNPPPAVTDGAAIFSAQVERISGAKLPIVKEGALKGASAKAGEVRAEGAQAFVLIGRSKLAEQFGATAEGLGAGGILMKVQGNAAALLGPDAATPSDPNGTRYAVTTFLEDALGVRFLWPGELGLVTPKRRTIALEAMERKFTPMIGQRQIRSARYNDRTQAGLDYLGLTRADYSAVEEIVKGSGPAAPGWFEWQRLGGNAGLVGGHAFGYVWEKYHAAHPEWFAMQPNGSRDMTKFGGDRARLCKSNLGLIEAIAKDKIEEMERTGRESASLAPNDGGTATFCMCPDCKKLDPPNGRKITLWDNSSQPRKDFEYVSLTDRMVWFWNRIAERVVTKHPNATLTVYAYSAYSAPPVREKLHPSLAVGFTEMAYSRDSERAQALTDWDAWAKATNKLYWRPNALLYARREGTPGVYVHKLASDVQYFAHHGLLATDFDSCMHHWSTQGLNYYILARLLWHPEANVDQLVEDYCRAGFGKAAPQIRKYYARIEGITDAAAKDERQPVLAYQPEVIAELSGILAEADRAAQDETVHRRIAFLRDGLEFTTLQSRAHQYLADHAEERGSIEERTGLRKLQEQKWNLMRRMLREDPLAVNVAMVAWGSEAAFHKFGWAGAKSVGAEKNEADEKGRPVQAK
jgi:hypothetical protein